MIIGVKTAVGVGPTAQDAVEAAYKIQNDVVEGEGYTENPSISTNLVYANGEFVFTLTTSYAIAEDGE